jgi:hypothetical protein
MFLRATTLGDLLGVDAALADIHTLYACHDRLLAHKAAVFDHLVGRWGFVQCHVRCTRV